MSIQLNALFLQVRTRGLPDDHVGQVRVVEIEGWW
jgi:hypothetical protein